MRERKSATRGGEPRPYRKRGPKVALPMARAAPAQAAAYALEIDPVADSYERRRAACVRLPACEEAWCLARVAAGESIATQARCPAGCRGDGAVGTRAGRRRG